MHKLTRPTQPACLSRYKHGRDNWNKVSTKHKDEIWLKICKMQQHRCAYCETGINKNKKDGNCHIEHFRQKGRYPQGTFLWINMFGSCDSCGKHKDSSQVVYCHRDLIKADEEDPEIFLAFAYDGNVAPTKGLTPTNLKRAEETIRVFNLNGPLRKIRETTLKGYRHTAEEFVQYAIEFDKDDWRPILQKELDRIEYLPFATAIKHTLLLA